MVRKISKRIVFQYASTKFKVLFKRRRYKLAFGGRGGAKSHSYARALLEIGSRRKTRIVCGRETQNSIKDSIKYLFDQVIKDNELDDQYISKRDYILNTVTGTYITFIGLQDYNSQQVKGLEGCDIFFGDEANQFSQKTLDYLIPTIRKPKSEIWFCWNPEYPMDAIEDFRTLPDDIAFKIEISWKDNRFLSQEAIDEKDRKKEKDYDDYLHVWEGHYKPDGDDKLISLKSVMEAKARVPEILDVPVFAGLDPARFGSDTAALTIRKGNQILLIKEWDKCSVPELARWVGEYIVKYDVKCMAVDIGNLSGVFDLLTDPKFLQTYINQSICRVIEFNAGGKSPDTHYKNKRAYVWDKMRVWIETTGVLPHNQRLESELIRQEKFINEQSQLQLLSKEQMRKKGIKSPNIADSASFTWDPAMEPPTQIVRKPRGQRTWAG